MKIMREVREEGKVILDEMQRRLESHQESVHSNVPTLLGGAPPSQEKTFQIPFISRIT